MAMRMAVIKSLSALVKNKLEPKKGVVIRRLNK